MAFISKISASLSITCDVKQDALYLLFYTEASKIPHNIQLGWKSWHFGVLRPGIEPGTNILTTAPSSWDKDNIIILWIAFSTVRKHLLGHVIDVYFTSDLGYTNNWVIIAIKAIAPKTMTVTGFFELLCMPYMFSDTFCLPKTDIMIVCVIYNLVSFYPHQTVSHHWKSSLVLNCASDH